MNNVGNSSQDTLEATLRGVEETKHGSYDKRTEHLDENGRGTFINRLINEDSPYLLQHAHNPVNWYAWGDEAFAAAEAQQKPIFLSIGYSTCHWCHVMEVESFDNPDVAAVLNEHFVSIKMDREQYPDVDEVYMTGVQIMTGHGGWPMSNLLLPSGEPFFGATYFPAQQFIAILKQVVTAWQDKREELETSAKQVQQAIEKILGDRAAVAALDATLAEDTVVALLEREDEVHGGLTGAPKFPQEPLLLLLLNAARRGDASAQGFVERALECMAQGGIYDQVAGGFSRYSVDEHWLVPHFEKMLYNQSQLGLVLLEAYELSGRPFFLRVLTQTLDYVLRDMQRPEGGFYSATDADSEGEEGVFFTWTPADLAAALSEADADFTRALFGVTEAGNFEGSTILCLKQPLEKSAQSYDSAHGESGEAFYTRLDRVLAALYAARETRVHPLRDDKLIVAWTGAMVTTLARAAGALGSEAWLEAARRAAAVVLKENVDAAGCVRRIALAGTVSINGQLEDYANFAESLITLADAESSLASMTRRLGDAQRVVNAMLREFWDAEADGFFLGPNEQVGPRLVRSKSASDGATLSPVATALRCLHLLDARRELLADNAAATPDYADFLRRGLNAVSGQLNEHPLSHASLLRVHSEIQNIATGRHLVLAGGISVLKLIGHPQAVNTGESQVFEVSVLLGAGWHLSVDAASDASAPLAITAAPGSAWQIETVEYPQAAAGRLSGESRIVLRAHRRKAGLADTVNKALRLLVDVQLCSESECLLAQRCELVG